MAQNISRDDYNARTEILAYEILKLKRKVERNNTELFLLNQNYEHGAQYYSLSAVMSDSLKHINSLVQNNDFGNHLKRMQGYKKQNAQAQYNTYINEILPECQAVENELKLKEAELEELHRDMFGNSNSQASQAFYNTNQNNQAQALSLQIENMKDSVNKIETAIAFKTVIDDRKNIFEKIEDIKKERIATNNPNAKETEMNTLTLEIQKKDMDLENYIHNFWMNPNYYIPAEIKELIGGKVDANGNRLDDGGKPFIPTVADLIPIEKLEKKLNTEKMRIILLMSDEDKKNFLSNPNLTKQDKKLYETAEGLDDAEKARIRALPALPEDERKKIIKDIAAAEDELGYKSILKLKIQKLKDEIEDLKEEYKTAAPDRKLEIEKLLSEKSVELENMEKEFNKIFEAIGTMIMESIERSECAFHSVSNKNELKLKLSNAELQLHNYNAILQGQNIQTPQSPSGQPTNITPQNVNHQNAQTPQMQSSNVPSNIQPANINVAVPHNSNVAPNNNSNSKVAANVTAPLAPTANSKLSFWSNFIGGLKNQDPNRVLTSNIQVVEEADLEDDVVFQRTKFPLPKIEGEYFYHTIEQDGKLKYIKEPLENINCSKKEILAKIKEIQEYWKARDISTEVPLTDQNDMKFNLSLSPKALYSRCVGLFSKRKRQEVMCGIIAANSKLEAMYAIQWGIPRDVVAPNQLLTSILTKLNMIPVTQTPQPQPAPVTQTPQPQPAPVTQTPQPQPAPVTQTPQPQPAPVTQTPQPQPVPVTQTPQPQPAPVTQTPQPQPVPVTQTPQPQPVPVTQTPQPQPVPVTPTPQSQPAPVTQTPQPQAAPANSTPQPQSAPVNQNSQQQNKPRTSKANPLVNPALAQSKNSAVKPSLRTNKTSVLKPQLRRNRNDPKDQR